MSASDFDRLVALMARLRAPDGCPWDQEQTMGDLGRYIREDADEVVEAIGKGARHDSGPLNRGHWS